jgi:hypothetical protein
MHGTGLCSLPEKPANYRRSVKGKCKRCYSSAVIILLQKITEPTLKLQADNIRSTHVHLRMTKINYIIM